MIDEKIKRINQLAQKSRTPQGLTDAEKQEQAALRQEYVQSFRQSLRRQLENTDVTTPDGVTRPLVEKKG